MKSKLFLIATLLTVGVAASACSRAEQSANTPAASSTQTAAQQSPATGKASAPESSQVHEHNAREAARVPAFETDAASLKMLPPTLAPEMFWGKQREAYKAVKEIPQTIAQLPCYCHCDRGFGHKSLHSCYMDDHAAHCAVCVDEALLAYRLQKEEKLNPEQIRQRIIAHYSSSE